MHLKSYVLKQWLTQTPQQYSELIDYWCENLKVRKIPKNDFL